MIAPRPVPRPALPLALALLLAAPPAAAADLARSTCGQLMGLSPGDRGQVLLWLHGYYAGAAQRTLLEPDRIAQGTQALQKLYEATPGMALIGAEARAALLGDGPPVPSATAQGSATIQAPPQPPLPAASGGRAAPSPPAAGLPPAIPRPVREPAQ